MRLTLERCTIREWRLDDAPSLARHANNREVWLHLRDLFPHPYTLADANEFLRRATTAQPATNFCLEIDRSAAGGIGLHLGEDVHRFTASIGYWLSQDFWGHGVMSEAVAAVTAWSFDNFSLQRISAEVYANNPASARVLEKAGFNFEGRLRQNVVKDGQILDSLLYARTR